MTITTIGTLLGRLDVETVAPSWDGQHDGLQTVYRPRGIYLDNDGRWHHWMAPGHDYELERDVQGWVVTCGTWPGGHTYRLGTDEKRAFALPADGAMVHLDDARRYGIRSTWSDEADRFVFDLYEF
jgi:hypothetical protein